MKKTFLKFLLSFLIIFGLGFSSDILAREVSGWAWSENIGWISFNSRNCDVTPRPTGCPTGVIPAYGIRIEADGRMTGHAWSSNIGWISFTEAELSGCPLAPCRAWIGVDNNVNGWARACTVFLDPNLCSGALNPNRGGWDGWIRLRGTTTAGVPYGVWLDTTVTPNQFRGWAWSNMVVGWISFNSSNCDVPPPGTRPLGCPVGTIPAYRVEIFNRPPRVDPPFSPTGNLIPDADRCLLRQDYRFSWTFHDPGDTQSALRIQVTTSTIFDITTGPYKFDRTVSSTVSSIFLGPFAWNTTYHWRVMVWDRDGATSTWSTTTSFRTPVHEPPRVSFIWTPARPASGETVRFTDNSTCFRSGGATTTCASRAWDFNNDGITDSTTTPATTTFPTAGRYTVNLRVTDGSGFTCSDTRVIAIGHPRWIEIPPIIWMRNLWASVTDITNGLRNRAIVFLNNF